MNASCEAIAGAALGEPVKREGSELLYRCPDPERHTNGDTHPSFKINPKKNTWGCFVCGIGGTPWQLAAFLARLDPSDKPGVTAWLRERGLINGTRENGSRPSASSSRRVAEFYYSAELRKVRFEPGRDGRSKEFIWEHLEGETWKAGDSGIKDKPLYTNALFRELRERSQLGIVLALEGEGKADHAGELGFAAISFKELQPENGAQLAGLDLVLWPDKDQPGTQQSHKAATILHDSKQPRSIRIITPPAELLEGGDIVDAVRSLGWGRAQIDNLIRNAAEWKPQSVDAARMLHQVFCFIRRFVFLSYLQARVLTLWVVHTHAFSAASATPYMAINSAEKQCGKTRLLEVLNTLVASPWMTGRVTAAVLTRKIDKDHPTLLLDESDAAFGGEKEYSEALRGILNTGYAVGGSASCCIGQGAAIGFKDFSTFCPKAIAGIGSLPDTVADRSIPIQLKRAAPGEVIERFRRRDVEASTGSLRVMISKWCIEAEQILRDARPELPEELTDRQHDVAEPLLAIADAAGGEWPTAARAALVQLCAEARQAEKSVGVQLLADIRQILSGRKVDRIWSEDLAGALAEIETSPWAEWSKGKPLTKEKLARLLKPFSISPDSVRIGDRTKKGYTLSGFSDAFSRYLPPEKRNNGITRISIEETADFEGGTELACSVSENAKNPSKNARGSSVPVLSPASAGEAEIDLG